MRGSNIGYCKICGRKIKKNEPHAVETTVTEFNTQTTDLVCSRHNIEPTVNVGEVKKPPLISIQQINNAILAGISHLQDKNIDQEVINLIKSIFKPIEQDLLPPGVIIYFYSCMLDDSIQTSFDIPHIMKGLYGTVILDELLKIPPVKEYYTQFKLDFERSKKDEQQATH